MAAHLRIGLRTACTDVGRYVGSVLIGKLRPARLGTRYASDRNGAVGIAAVFDEGNIGHIGKRPQCFPGPLFLSGRKASGKIEANYNFIVAISIMKLEVAASDMFCRLVSSERLLVVFPMRELVIRHLVRRFRHGGTIPIGMRPDGNIHEYNYSGS